MKPQGNRLGIWTDRNARPQRTIGYEEEAQAKSGMVVLQESVAGKRNSESRDPDSGTNL
jgi:hypothetical protein